MTEATGKGSFAPTPRAIGLLLAATGVGLLGLAWDPLRVASLFADLLWVAALVVDGFRLRSQRLRGERRLPDVLLAFRSNRVEVWLHNPARHPISGAWRDTPPDDVEAPGRRQRFLLGAGERVGTTYPLPAPPRGRLVFGDLHVAITGQWGMAAVERRIPAAVVARSIPGVSESLDGEIQLRQQQESGRVRLRRLIEGREFDALREFRPGDDLRMVDWKASARRGEPIVREYSPEQNQMVVLMMDCGRHMVAHQAGRSKLDHALEAALRLARTCLERGDLVGMVAFGATVRAWVAPAKGQRQLRTLVEATYDAQPEIEESDYRLAFEVVQERLHRRALVCIFTEVGDEDSSRVLLARTLGLRPKHLPVLVLLDDPELARLTQQSPSNPEAAYARAAAVRLARERDRTRARLRGGGVTVVRALPEGLSLATIQAYLGIKSRGLL